MDSESNLISLITQLMSLEFGDFEFLFDSKSIPLIIQIIHLGRSMDLDLLPNPKSELMSLVTQTISIDLDSQPEELLELISLITQVVNSKDSDWDLDYSFSMLFALDNTYLLEPEPDLMSLIHQILSLVVSMNSKWKKLISFCPQVEVDFKEGKIHVAEKHRWIRSNKLKCLPFNWEKLALRKGEDATHFYCSGCYGENHKEYEQAPLEIKHPLHPKHSLQLVFHYGTVATRECYCCNEDLKEIFYYCLACDYALNIACVEKHTILAIDHPKWHEHKLAHFPRQASLTCDLCALADSCSPFYICLLCDFVAHRRCNSLPSVIRISRHLHRISFTHSFDQRDLSCGICRRKINKHYGGYSCIKNDCSYAAHSRCATQSNVWDDIDLEGVPEEIEEEIVEPFVTISDGIIEHFSHEQHHLRLDENTDRDYDEDKLCHACITPIYFGNFYSCMQCDFILHKACANFPRKIHHPIHPHLLNLALEGGRIDFSKGNHKCSACHGLRTAGFLYECSKEGCFFKLHVQCATISEPLVHGSHIHPLFLTSKPEEQRECSVCHSSAHDFEETFNCIESECNFSLCYKCATIPEKVRYKHDKHILTLSYGDQEMMSTMTYWCEACEGQIKPKERFYKCDEYCCVTLHIECLIGKDLYVKSGSSWFPKGDKLDVMPISQPMSRPTCSHCEKRSPYKVVFHTSESIFCSLRCLAGRIYETSVIY